VPNPDAQAIGDFCKDCIVFGFHHQPVDSADAMGQNFDTQAIGNSFSMHRIYGPYGPFWSPGEAIPICPMSRGDVLCFLPGEPECGISASPL